jgi:hypothetical protein
MVTVDVCIYSIESFEHLKNERTETAWKGNTWSSWLALIIVLHEVPIPILLGNICSLSTLL